MFNLPALKSLPEDFTVALDLEIADELEDGHRKAVHEIACIGLHLYQVPDPTPITPPVRLYNDNGTPLDAHQCLALMDWLYPAKPRKVVTFNGVSFDMPVIGAMTKDNIGTIELALTSLDLMMVYVWGVGWPTKLDASLQQMGLQSKAHNVQDKAGNVVTGFSGALAPEYWRRGEHELVLTYLDRDIAATAELHCAALRMHQLRSASASGRPNQCRFQGDETTLSLLKQRWSKADWLANKGEDPYKFSKGIVEWMVPAITDTFTWGDSYALRQNFMQHFPSLKPLDEGSLFA